MASTSAVATARPHTVWTVMLYAIPVVMVSIVCVSAGLGSWLPMLGLAGLLVAVVMVIRPAVAVVVMLLSWGGPVDITLLTRSIGGLRIGPGEAALGLGLLGVLIARVVRRRVIKSASRSRFAGVVIFYLVAVAFGLVLAQRGGDSLGQGASVWLTSCSVLAYFVMREVYAERPRRFAETLVLVTGLCCVVVLIATVLNIRWLTGRLIDYVITEGEYSAALRLDPPLLRVLSLTVLMATVGGVLSETRWRWLRYVLVAAMLVVEALSFTRSTWLPLIIVAIVLPSLISPRYKPGALVGRTVIAGVLIGVLLAGASFGLFGGTARTVGFRLISTTSSDVFEDTSLRDRYKENAAAWTTIKQHPIMGVGLPRPYGAFTVSDSDPVTGDEILMPQRFIHNTYLGIWAWLGMPGVLALLATVFAGLRAFGAVLLSRFVDRRPALACFGGLVVLAVSSSLQTNLLYQPALFAVASGLAYLDVWLGSRRPNLTEGRGVGPGLRRLGATRPV